MALGLWIALGITVFIALVVVLAKLSYVKPKYRSRPGGIRYVRRNKK